MNKIVILYSTTDGQTLKISNKLQEVLEEMGKEVRVIAIDAAMPNHLDRADKIIIGASIRYGKHNKSVYDFIAKNISVLELKSNAFFSVSAVARKPNRNSPETNPYLMKFLSQVSWEPEKLAVFAGKIDYQKYGFVDRMVIRLIMHLTHGPTDPNAAVEFTDWQKVEEFGKMLGEMQLKT